MKLTATPETHTKRLRRLLAIVKRFRTEGTRSRFFMGWWLRHRGTHRPDLNHHCGTTACALGHAALDPAFRRAGLRVDWLRDGEGWKGVVYFGALIQGTAGSAFFGLTSFEGKKVWYAINRAAVIERLTQYIERRCELGNGLPSDADFQNRTEGWTT